MPINNFVLKQLSRGWYCHDRQHVSPPSFCDCALQKVQKPPLFYIGVLSHNSKSLQYHNVKGIRKKRLLRSPNRIAITNRAMAKKRKSVATSLDEVDRTMYASFCSAANSLSQLYTQAMNHQKFSFQAGERHGLVRITLLSLIFTYYFDSDDIRCGLVRRLSFLYACLVIKVYRFCSQFWLQIISFMF